MELTPTAPPCFVRGCERISALTDVSRGAIFTYLAHFCAECYQRLIEGERLPVERERIIVRYTADERGEGNEAAACLTARARDDS